MEEVVLGIDLGSTGVRCLIADLKGRPVSICSRAWFSSTPEDLAPLGREFKAEQLWQTICEVVKEALRKIGGVKKLVGVSATAQREGVVFLDKGGKELYSGPNLDLRALSEGAQLDEQLGGRIHSLTGHLPSFLFVPAKLKWFKKHRPEIYSRIATLLSLDGWIIYRLTGELAGEFSSFGELGLLDIHSNKRSPELEELLQIPDVFPRLGRAGERVGEISRKAADETGLPEGVPVSLGSSDTQCGLLGLGLRQTGEVGIITGWSCAIQMLLDRPVFDRRLWTGSYPLGKWTLESNAGDLGGTWHWLGEVFGEDETRMDELAERALGCSGALAWLSPRAMDMTRLGMRWGGFLFPLPPSIAGVDRAGLIRAALEGICFAIKANLLQLEEVSGERTCRIGLGGGLARSRALAQILPQVLGRPVLQARLKEISALGAVICAAAEQFKGLEEAQEAMKVKLELLEPDPGSSLEYEEKFERWNRLMHAIESMEAENELGEGKGRSCQDS